MRVGIDATCWSNPRGYGRYARGLLAALLAEPSSHDFVLFVDAHTRSKWPMPDGAGYVVVPTTEAPTVAASASGRRSVRDLLAMTRAVARAPLDVMFYPSVYSYFPAVTRARVVLGVHDVIAEDHPRLVFPHRRQRLMWAAKGRLARWQADHIVAVSEHSKAGIVRRFGWPPERVRVVGEAPDPVFRPVGDTAAIGRALARHGLGPAARFIVYLGGLNPHKNLGALFGALAGLRREARFADLRLLLVGPAESDTFTPGALEARRAVARLGIEAAVGFTGYVPDDEVACLLNAARALVLPSFDEGFGLPAVEAAACGTPVVATRNSPLPRLLEGGGLFVDPHRPEELRAALARLLGDEAGRRQTGRVARERARALTWQRAAAQFRALLAAMETRRKLEAAPRQTSEAR